MHRTPAQAGPQSRCRVQSNADATQALTHKTAGFIEENGQRKKTATSETASVWRNLRNEEKFQQVKPSLPIERRGINSNV
ncbi:MAG TPA: hypothetical protein VFY06_10810 [Verrucomicrobiae bacterium]|nr:hypothetical protein [Verrucomicrobiae bacterium]